MKSNTLRQIINDGLTRAHINLISKKLINVIVTPTN